METLLGSRFLGLNAIRTSAHFAPNIRKKRVWRARGRRKSKKEMEHKKTLDPTQKRAFLCVPSLALACLISVGRACGICGGQPGPSRRFPFLSVMTRRTLPSTRFRIPRARFTLMTVAGLQLPQCVPQFLALLLSRFVYNSFLAIIPFGWSPVAMMRRNGNHDEHRQRHNSDTSVACRLGATWDPALRSPNEKLRPRCSEKRVAQVGIPTRQSNGSGTARHQRHARQTPLQSQWVNLEQIGTTAACHSGRQESSRGIVRGKRLQFAVAARRRTDRQWRKKMFATFLSQPHSLRIIGGVEFLVSKSRG
ncbi:hypothetical protein ECC02_011337 [Trypanosoma cruzi]|uniref:Uncharacterized protein n=1 Tax=Trypanosoma cruzi TaxID=5693 RepID=A0A7J6XPN7_TRYCR|nr:hypothetical protein ECC02_011337 [Trypanosoma cruzi]